MLCLSIQGQDYVGTSIRLGSSNYNNKFYIIGTLPKTSSSVYQKLKVVVNGGNWHNSTTGENEYYISTRDGVVINQEVHGGESSRYKLLVFDNGSHYDFVISPTAGYPFFNIRSWIICDSGYLAQEIVNYNPEGKTDVTSKFNVNKILITSRTGNIGIGKESSSNYKLDVAGTIRADEIKVEDIAATNIQLEGNIAANQITVKANGNTADFVFSNTYNLKDLVEVENYIKTHKHLPDIPSAEEMEASGVNLAEMNKLLLQKVEELTLYSIQQAEKLKELENIKEQLKEMEVLKAEISTIKAMMNR